ncbi:MAG: FAD-dependent oxidoreductase [Candidatus Cyclobacteriaceae bacterium M3_2C_046]
MRSVITRLFVLVWVFASCQHESPEAYYDVCVYSGTSAGVSAAYAAAKEGKKVLLIEPRKHLGGMTASGLGMTDVGDKNAISGFAREFYTRIAAHYGEKNKAKLVFEPHVAESVFNDLICESGADTLLFHRIISVEKGDNRLKSITLEHTINSDQALHRKIYAKVFIDCSYQGDLMALAGVSYTIGREDNQKYNEKHNGVQLEEDSPHQFMDDIDPYIIPGDSSSGLVYGITHPEKLAPVGSGDHKIQAYNYRVCLTNVKENMIPITAPVDYDPAKYELLSRSVEKKEWKDLSWQFLPFYRAALTISDMPNGKTDINNYGPFSTDFIGENWNYPEADYQERKEIELAHRNYQQGLFYFLGHSERIPKKFRDKMLTYGYPKDEFTDNGGWPFQIYVREARRMIGKYVMTEHNCLGKITVQDGIAIGSYGMDSHNCQRVIINGMVKNEGDVQVWEGIKPYPISYGSIVPQKAEAINLLVPVCVSASHIAFGSIRMEPVFMMMGQAAGIAASLSVSENLPVQDINIRSLQQKIDFNFN